jgi:metal-sulfur cluster biosynthetic enzyme
MDREEAYHRMHAEMWVDRLLATDEGRERLNEAVDELWPYALGVLDDALRPELRARDQERLGRAPSTASPCLAVFRGGAHRAVGGDDLCPALGATRCAVVTADDVWAALAEIPDPEIPVISLVDLGVVKEVTVANGTVHVGFTPTFMGCPALDAMKRAMEARRGTGATAVIDVRSTTRGRPTTSPPRAGRSSARPASRRRPRGRPASSS